MMTNTPSGTRTTASRSALVPPRAHVPRWTTAEQMDGWGKRIEAEPLRVLAEVVDQANQVHSFSRKTDGFSRPLIEQETAAQQQVPQLAETSKSAAEVVDQANQVHSFSRKLDDIPSRVLVELSAGTSLEEHDWNQAVSDFKVFRGERPEILAAMIKHRDLARRYSVLAAYKVQSRVWSVIDRVVPSDFVDIYAAVTHKGNKKSLEYLLALPDPMLPILADYFRRGGSDEDAFVCARHEFHPHTGKKYLGRLYPSKMFVGIDPVLDRRLFDEEKQYDIAFCTRLAGLGPDQRPYMEAYFKDGEEVAENLIRIPSWKRDLIDGDPESREIWKLLRVIFTYYRWGPDQITILAGRFMACKNPGRWATALIGYSCSTSCCEIQPCRLLTSVHVA